jgi:DNA-directed RNA polymerase beta' subunit
MDFIELQNSEIDHIIFGILSAEEIERMSVCHVTSSKPTGPDSVHDERMGAMKTNDTCITCGKNCKLCPGHFGHIELSRPVIHPLYHKMVCSFLNCFCFHCHNLLLSPEYLELNGLLYLSGNGRFKGILERVQKIDVCSAKLTCNNPAVEGNRYCTNHCENKSDCCSSDDYRSSDDDYRSSDDDYSSSDNESACAWTGTCGKHVSEFKWCPNDSIFIMRSKKKGKKTGKKTSQTIVGIEDIKKTFDNIPDHDIKMLGLDPSRVHPKNLVLTVFPVIPPIDRPYVIQGPEGKVCDDDLTSTLIELIKANNQLKKPDLREDKALKAEQTINFRISTFMNNEAGKARHTNGENNGREKHSAQNV